jgi:ribonucleoside-diphosphate reductase beta chain
MDQHVEPILRETSDKYTVFPINHQDIWINYEYAIANFWTVEEIDFSKDLLDWVKLNKDEQHFIKNILAFFAASDGIVNENLVLNFYKEVQIPEMRQFYASQIMLESIHGHCYSLMIETYVKNEEEKRNLFSAVTTNNAVKLKADWAIKWITNGTFAERLLAFILVEGVFFSGSFCAIYWLKKRGLMPGLTKSNELISRDEALHCNAAITLYSKLENKVTSERAHSIFKEAVEIEKKFITESLPVKLIGMNDDMMKQYIEYVSDYWLSKLNYAKVFESKNPFDFMQYISLQDFGNFFETRITSYRKAGVGVPKEQNSFNIEEDF